MNKDEIIYFDKISDLQEQIDDECKKIERKISDYSTIIGEKIRQETDKNSNEELDELKQRLESLGESTGESKKKNSQKKKKSQKKKDGNTEWLELEYLSIYQGQGIKGELEIYFKSLDNLKKSLESLNKINESIGYLIKKGIKRDISFCCIWEKDMPMNIAFTVKTENTQQKFQFNSIINIPAQNHRIEIN